VEMSDATATANKCTAQLMIQQTLEDYLATKKWFNYL